MLTRLQYLLTKLAEEANEVGQMSLKSQQFGLDERKENNVREPTNKTRLHDELNDLFAIVKMLNEEFGFDYNIHDPWNVQRMAEKIERVNHWHQYSIRQGLCEGVVIPDPEPVPVPEVDRSKVALTGGGDPKDESYKEIKSNGQQKEYLVLSEEERAKGFVRPVRSSYVHVGEKPKYPLRDLTPEENERFKNDNYIKYEEYPESESPSCGRYWTKLQLQKGCGHTTTMGKSLSETYARDPKFYGATFCSNCGVHFPVREFVWAGTEEVVGS